MIRELPEVSDELQLLHHDVGDRDNQVPQHVGGVVHVGRHQALRLISAVAGGLVLVGCTPPAPVPAPTSPPAPSTPVHDVAPPKPVDGEIARIVWDGTLQSGQAVSMDVSPATALVAQGACDGGGDLALSYRVLVDGLLTDSGTIPCSTGTIYANTVLGQVNGHHVVRLEVGDEVQNTRSAWVRIIPATAL